MLRIVAISERLSPYRLGNIDVSILDVSDSYVILTLTICGFVGHDFEFLIEDEMGNRITIDGF